jgi:uncharacterized protein Yka (UPF0111/DUF47 family)
MRLIPKIILTLAGSGNKRFIAELVAQLDCAIDGAVLTRRIIAGEIGRVEGLEQMLLQEHTGDDARSVLVEDLRDALVTPIDREDLFRLSRSIDDVLDTLRDVVVAWIHFEMVGPCPLIDPVVAAICDSLKDFRAVVAALGDSSAGSRTLSAKKSGNSIRKAHDVQLAALLREKTEMAEVIKIQTLLRRLDVVGLRYAEAVDHLADAMIKRAED